MGEVSIGQGCHLPCYNNRHQHRTSHVCPLCRVEIKVAPSRFRNSRRVFCSRACANKGMRAPITEAVMKLYREGKKIREIAVMLQRSESTVGGLLHRRKLKMRWGTGTHPTSLRERFKKLLSDSCQLCGYARVVELAHIWPAAKGGRFELENLVVLCPNCHHLFDHQMLTEEEQWKLCQIKEVVNAIEAWNQSGNYLREHQRTVA